MHSCCYAFDFSQIIYCTVFYFHTLSYYSLAAGAEKREGFPFREYGMDKPEKKMVALKFLAHLTVAERMGAA